MKLSKLSDYAVVLLSYLSTKGPLSANALAEQTGVPAPTVAKLMKQLAKAEIVSATRGTQGGYGLQGSAAALSVAQIIAAVEGPIALTACVDESPDDCAVESTCGVAGNWESVNTAVRAALEQVKLTDMAPDWRVMFKTERVTP